MLVAPFILAAFRVHHAQDKQKHNSMFTGAYIKDHPGSRNACLFVTVNNTILIPLHSAISHEFINHSFNFMPIIAALIHWYIKSFLSISRFCLFSLLFLRNLHFLSWDGFLWLHLLSVDLLFGLHFFAVHFFHWLSFLSLHLFGSLGFFSFGVNRGFFSLLGFSLDFLSTQGSLSSSLGLVSGGFSLGNPFVVDFLVLLSGSQGLFPSFDFLLLLNSLSSDSDVSNQPLDLGSLLPQRGIWVLLTLECPSDDVLLNQGSHIA